MKLLFYFVLVLLPFVVPAQNTVLWKVTNSTGKKVSYLMGTYHVVGNSFLDDLPLVKEKIDSSNVIITELEINLDKWAELYNSRPSSDTLASIVSREDFKLIASIFSIRKLDITKLTPGELILRLRNYYSLYKCSPRKSTDSFYLDEYVQHLGKKAGKKLIYLENDTFQIQILNDLTAGNDWNYFRKNINALLQLFKSEKVYKPACEMVNQYTDQRINYNLKSEMPDNMQGMDNKVLVQKRNDEWLQKLPPLLDNNQCFIAVGLGHLFYKSGIIVKLRELGYIVEPVIFK